MGDGYIMRICVCGSFFKCYDDDHFCSSQCYDKWLEMQENEGDEYLDIE